MAVQKAERHLLVEATCRPIAGARNIAKTKLYDNLENGRYEVFDTVEDVHGTECNSRTHAFELLTSHIRRHIDTGAEKPVGEAPPHRPVWMIVRYVDEETRQDLYGGYVSQLPRVGEDICVDDEAPRECPGGDDGYVVTAVHWYPKRELAIVLCDGRASPENALLTAWVRFQYLLHHTARFPSAERHRTAVALDAVTEALLQQGVTLPDPEELPDE